MIYIKKLPNNQSYEFENTSVSSENFEEYVTTEEALYLKEELKDFAKAYNRFSEVLDYMNFWKQYPSSVFKNSLFLSLFREEKKYKGISFLTLNPNVFQFLAKLKEKSLNTKIEL